MRMTKRYFWTLFSCLSLIYLVSCKKDLTYEKISQDALSKIAILGFSTDDLQKDVDGYIAEGDIILSDKYINTKPHVTFLKIAGTEQYSTFNLIKKLPKTLTINISTLLPYSYALALDEAI